MTLFDARSLDALCGPASRVANTTPSGVRTVNVWVRGATILELLNGM